MSSDFIFLQRTHNTQTGDQGTYARNPVKKSVVENWNYIIYVVLYVILKVLK